jgi:hypothetical protein
MREKVALRYKLGSRWFDSPWRYWDFLLNSSGYTMALTAVAQWLRYCSTNSKVAGSIPESVIGIFH